MRIGINALALDPTYRGGVNTFTFGLLDGFAKVGDTHTFQIYCTETNQKEFERYTNCKNFEVICLPGYLSFFLRLIRRLGIESRSQGIYRKLGNFFHRRFVKAMCEKSDLIYISTVNLFPFNYTVPTFVSMHDIQQKFFPEFFDRQELLYRDITYTLTAEHSDYIQASSTYMKENFLEHYPVLKPNQIFVISEGVDIDTFSKKEFKSTALEKYQLPRRFLFFPGQLWHHKNHITVLRALQRLKKEKNVEVPLILTGAKFSASQHIFDFIQEHAMENFVRYLGKVPFADLIALYQSATFLITAVLYESSSLPILEAAAAGLPVIASRTPPNVEMSGKIEMNLFEPRDDQELAGLIWTVWNNPDLSRSQKELNLKAVHQYSWPAVASQYLEYFESKVLKHYATTAGSV
jgi:glycosyltransferase involved in cell wall biosynthesis